MEELRLLVAALLLDREACSRGAGAWQRTASPFSAFVADVQILLHAIFKSLFIMLSEQFPRQEDKYDYMRQLEAHNLGLNEVV